MALCLAGCGGGGGQATPPVPQDESAIEGQVDIQGAAGDYDLLLDGQPVPGALNDDGTYAIENVPPGQHRVAVIARDGMAGGYATVDVPTGRRARAPRIVPDIGGQIVGIVTVVEDGTVRPLAGAEVTAQPAVMIMTQEDPDGDTPDGDRPMIYPPPDDLPTFTAFTGEDGSFAIRAVPQGEYTVSVAMPNMEDAWQWTWVGAGRTAVADFRLRPAIEPGVGTVEGRVLGLEDGQRAPLAGARVTVRSGDRWVPVGPPAPPPMEPHGEANGAAPAMPDPGMIAPPGYEGVSTITDARGRYSLNAPAGYATIEVYLPGWEPVVREIEIRADQSAVANFTLEALGDWPPPPPPGYGEGGTPGEGPDDGSEPPPPPDLGDETPAPPPESGFVPPPPPL
jgi:hypothetical protein